MSGDPRSSSKLSLRVRQVAALVLCSILLAASATQAQSVGGLPGFLQNLFGFGARQAPHPPPNASLKERARKPAARKKTQDFVSSTATRAPGTPGGAPLTKPTFFVSVIGDSLAILAAQGLVSAFSANPEVVIDDRARDVSGLTRDDYYDWPKAVRDLLATQPKIDVLVVMFGINDVQPLKDGGEMLDLLSDKWRTVYGQRVDALLQPFRDAQIPVLWVGLPPMRDERLNAQAAALNELYRDHAGKDGATYVDIWDAFADAQGQYAAFGPDVEGQNAKLRNGAGGIYFTKPGSRKVAQFLEADIRRRFEKGKPQSDLAALPPDIEKQASDINAEILRSMGEDAQRAGAAMLTAKPVAGPIISLTAAPATLGGALVGPGDTNAIRVGASQGGISVPGAPAGRADNFSWPPN